MAAKEKTASFSSRPDTGFLAVEESTCPGSVLLPGYRDANGNAMRTTGGRDVVAIVVRSNNSNLFFGAGSFVEPKGKLSSAGAPGS